MSKIVPISFHAVFQFHYGTIKSKKLFLSISDFYYFNSTMVRLKEYRLAYYPCCHGDFNSTMVRLKEETKRQRRVRAIIFQFHYGTIKSSMQ